MGEYYGWYGLDFDVRYFKYFVHFSENRTSNSNQRFSNISPFQNHLQLSGNFLQRNFIRQGF